jgi:hypothetical protein
MWCYVEVSDDIGDIIRFMTGTHREFVAHPDDLFADDYEVQELEVKLSSAEFAAACERVLPRIPGNGHNAHVHDMFRRLGLALGVLS